MRRVGVEFFQADGQTDMAKLISTFRNFANALKTCQVKQHTCIKHTNIHLHSEGVMKLAVLTYMFACNKR